MAVTSVDLDDHVLAELTELSRDTLQRARDGGADAAEALVTRDVGMSVTARQRDIETLEFQNDRAFGITVYVARAKGSASTADFSAHALALAVDKALTIARQTTADEYAGLADPDRLASAPPAIELDVPWALGGEAARELALATEAAALDADPRISNSEGATVSTQRALRVYANSHGFSGAYRHTRHSIGCAVIAADGEQMERDYHYTVARANGDLEATTAVGATAAARTLARLGSRKVPTGEAPVLFAADMARGLLGHAAAAMGGAAQYRRASFLLDARGEAVFPEWLQWDELPHLARALGSAPYDDEGVATVPRRLVEDGRFTGYILSSYSARRLGLETTGNAGGLHNVVVSDSRGGTGDILAGLERGLLVTELMGQGVNPVTGDYSRGVAGFWVERGAIQYPVAEVTIAGNLRDMYRRIVAVGDDRDVRGAIRTGSLLVDGMTIAGR